MISFTRSHLKLGSLLILLLITLSYWSHRSSSSSLFPSSLIGSEYYYPPSRHPSSSPCSPENYNILDTQIRDLQHVIKGKIKQYDEKQSLAEFGLRLGVTSMEEYIAELQDTYNRYFLPSHISSSSDSTNQGNNQVSSWFSSTSRRFSKQSPLITPDAKNGVFKHTLNYLNYLPNSLQEVKRKKLPKKIYTTDIKDPDKIPEQFQSWMIQNKGWDVRFVDDEHIDSWLEEVVPGSLMQEEFLKLSGKRGVVRSDLFRYLVLYLHGGIYSDTDTSCVRPIESWGEFKDIIPVPSISNETQLLDLPQSCISDYASSLSSSSSSSPSNYLVPEDEGDDPEDTPSFMVSLEWDNFHNGPDYKGREYIRGLQIIQWTILSKKGHPILLDVLGRGLREATKVREREEREEMEKKERERLTGVEEKLEELDEQKQREKKFKDLFDILELAGPGPYTDAIYRYLLIRYGFNPKDISGINQPVRIGDVLIYPLNGFRADSSDGDQGPNRVVWHGSRMMGRWKPKGLFN